MASNEETNAAGTDTRPPMLVESDYDSWKIRIHRYIRGKPNGKQIWKSIQNGPTPHPMITDPPPTESAAVPAPRKKLDSEFSEEENKLEMADTQAEIILSQGLPRHIFNNLNQTSTAKEIWDNVEMLMQGSGISQPNLRSESILISKPISLMSQKDLKDQDILQVRVDPLPMCSSREGDMLQLQRKEHVARQCKEQREIWTLSTSQKTYLGEQAYCFSCTANEIASQASKSATPATPFVRKSRPPSQVLASLRNVNAVFPQFEGRFQGYLRFGNDEYAAIIGYGDYKLGDTIISRVYYVEGLKHNLFSVGQFCDGGLEVAFRQHSCHIRNYDMVDSSSKGKSKKASHPLKTENTNTEVLHTLHMDLCGPMRTESINGKKKETIYNTFGVFLFCAILPILHDVGNSAESNNRYILLGYAPTKKRTESTTKERARIQKPFHSCLIDELPKDYVLFKPVQACAPQQMNPVPNSNRLELNCFTSGLSRSAPSKQDPEPPSVPPTKKQ
ncbi:hypothetical protein Tco_0013174 [Tanacetum coccineum]